MTAMSRTGIKRLHLKNEGVELELERETEQDIQFAQQSVQIAARNPMLDELEEHRVSVSPSKLKEKSENSEEINVNSPMVGTFYSASSPENPPFVQAGDQIQPDTVVCIVEAMKVMNEVKAGISGKVAEVLVKNGDPVEFGTPLLRVE